MYRVSRLLLMLFVVQAAWAQTPTVRRFEIFEQSIRHEAVYQDPYRDVECQVTYTAPGGKQTRFWGFYDGDQTWKVRFRPNNPGMWKYVARFSDGSKEVTGSFRCSHGSAKHTAIAINPVNPIWFRRGVDPFLVRAFHVGDRFFAANWPENKRKAFLDWAQQQGYNLISIASHYLNRDLPDRGRGWETPKLWPLNAAEYRRMEGILQDLLERGFIVFPFAGFFGKNSNYPRDPREQELYVRYTLARLAPYPHLLFNVAGPEPNLRKSWMASEDVVRLGRLIKKLDLFKHPLTVHNRTGDDPYRDSDWTSFGTLQGPKTVNRIKLRDGLLKNLHPAKPLFAQETLWSGNMYHIKGMGGRDYSDDDVRKNAIVLTMCAAGFCFADNQGNSSSGFSGSLDLKDCVQHRHDIIKRVWDFFETIPYFEMKPAPELVDEGYCLAEPGRRYLVYLEEGAAVNVNVKPGIPYSVTWIQGADTSVRHKGGVTLDGRHLTAPSDGDDWLLYIQSEGQGLPGQIHLSWQEDPSFTLTVTWHTDSQHNPTKVNYRKVGTSQWLQQQGASSASPGEGWLHRVQVKNLSPGTRYEYRVSSDRGVKPAFSAVYRTKTAPPPGPADLSFAFVTDTGLVGRLDGNTTGTQAIIDHIVRDQPLLVLGCGDYAYANRDGRFGGVAPSIDEWFYQYQPVLARFPFMAQYGNHEIYLTERFADWAPRFAHPDGFQESRCYSFAIGDAHFCSFFLPGRDLPKERLQWLDRDLAQARQKGARWLIVYHHEPIYAHGRSHPSRANLRDAIVPIMQKHKVDLHLSSHDQNYERTYPLVGQAAAPQVVSRSKHNYRQGAGVIYAKISPGGKKSEIGNSFSLFTVPQQDYIAVRESGYHHYGLIHIRASGELELVVYRIDDEGKNRTVADQFVIR